MRSSLFLVIVFLLVVWPYTWNLLEKRLYGSFNFEVSLLKLCLNIYVLLIFRSFGGFYFGLNSMMLNWEMLYIIFLSDNYSNVKVPINCWIFLGKIYLPFKLLSNWQDPPKLSIKTNIPFKLPKKMSYPIQN